MRLNEKTALLCKRLLLVPYEPHHVPTYHTWMEDPLIREATASERLTLEEELQMQNSWRKDKDKLTFICAFPPPRESELDLMTEEIIIAGKHDCPENLLGDINLFVYNDSDDDDDDAEEKKNVVGEIELMIPLAKHQGNGYGRAALLLFLAYIFRNKEGIESEYERGVTISKLRVKINQENVRSIRLFESIGFQKTVKIPNFFGEYELRRNLNDSFRWEVENLITRHGLDGWKELKYIRHD